MSATESDAALAPLAVGVNVTLIVQFAPAATLAPQVFVCAKSPGFAPAIEIPVMVNAAAPVLDKVTTFTALVVFRA